MMHVTYMNTGLNVVWLKEIADCANSSLKLQYKYGSQRRQNMNCSSRYKRSSNGGGNTKIHYITVLYYSNDGARVSVVD
jgi:hypothetical protein